MLIVAGTFDVAPEDREAFLRSREEAMRTSRAEPGCLDYAFSADPLDASRVILFERWESEEALAAHAAAMQAARAAAPPPAFTLLSSTITKYEIAKSGPLG